MALNVKLLRKIKRHILAKPRRLHMSWWAVHKDEEGSTYNGDSGRREKFEECGTAACIAGWACILSGIERPTTDDVVNETPKILGLDFSDLNPLFHTSRWGDLGIAYDTAKTPKKRAEIAAKRIDQFIKGNS